MMRRIITSMLLGLIFATTGCAFFEDEMDPAEQQYVIRKEGLEREIELLRLERRKILLQNSLDRLDAEPLPGEEAEETEKTR